MAEVSVVFQGPLARNLETLAANADYLRAHLPNAEIIFSGWSGDLEAAQEVLLKKLGTVTLQPDPGPTYHDPLTGVQHNVQRQVASTLAGIRAARGNYVAKMRSDVVIRNLNFFENLGPVRIRVLDIGTINPAKVPYLFHVSDLAQIGPRAAMLDLWNFDGPYETHQPLGEILLGKLLLGQTGIRFTKRSVEQEILLNWVKRTGHPMQLRWIDETHPDTAFLSERFICQRFVIIPYSNSGLILPARITFSEQDWFYEQKTLDKLQTITTPEAYRRRYRQIAQNRLHMCLQQNLFIKGLLITALYPLMMGIKALFPTWLIPTKPKPKELNVAISDMRVYMASFDDYSDLWEPFFKAFFHFWPDCPYPVSLGACEQSYPDARVETLHAFPHKNWSSRALEHLAQIKEPYVLITLDDFILRRPVRTETIAAVLEQMKILDLLVVRLYAEPGPRVAINGYPMIGLMGVGQQNRTSTHATIWHRETLISVIRAGESLWEFEVNAALRTLRFAHQVGGTWRTVLDYHMAVAKGRWFYTPAQVLIEQGFLQNPPVRAVMSRREELHHGVFYCLNQLAQRLTPLRWRQWVKSRVAPEKYRFRD